MTLTRRELLDLYRLTLTGDGDLDYGTPAKRVQTRNALRAKILEMQDILSDYCQCASDSPDVCDCVMRVENGR